jgi:hypothetical protein
LSLLFIAASAFDSLCALGAARATRRFIRQPASVPPIRWPDVSILKPLYGAEAQLSDNIETYFHQDYLGTIQFVFGVQDPNDSAIPVVRSLIARYPEANIQLVVNAATHGSNRKVSNLYLKHPYMSFYTGRGCKSRCTFCLWPQTVGGHWYRTRSVGHVIEEMKWAKKAFPEVKEFFLDDDTFTDDLPRAEAIARELGKLGVTWSCNAKANVPRATLKVLRDNGLRLLLVGYESGNQQILHNIKKGMRVACRQAVRQGLPRARHQDPWHVHLGPARRDAGDDQGDDRVRKGGQPAHAPGVARGALSGNIPL